MNTIHGYPVTVTAPTVASILFCSEYTVNDMARKGELPAFKAGAGWVFPTDALLQHLNNRGVMEAKERREAEDPTTRFVAMKGKPAKVRPDLSRYEVEQPRPTM